MSVPPALHFQSSYSAHHAAMDPASTKILKQPQHVKSMLCTKWEYQGHTRTTTDSATIPVRGYNSLRFVGSRGTTTRDLQVQGSSGFETERLRTAHGQIERLGVSSASHVQRHLLKPFQIEKSYQTTGSAHGDPREDPVAGTPRFVAENYAWWADRYRGGRNAGVARQNAGDPGFLPPLTARPKPLSMHPQEPAWRPQVVSPRKGDLTPRSYRF